MKTKTRRYLQFTRADLTNAYGYECFNEEWSRYVKTRLIQSGFDLTRRIFKASGVQGFDVVLAQEL